MAHDRHTPSLVTQTSLVNLVNLPETSPIYSLFGNTYSIGYSTNKAEPSYLYNTNSYESSMANSKLNDGGVYSTLSTTFGSRLDESNASLSIAKSDVITDILPTTLDFLTARSLDIVFRSTPRTILLDNIINTKRILSNRDVDFYNCRTITDSVLSYKTSSTDVSRIKEYRLLRQSNNYIPNNTDILSAEFHADLTITKTNPISNLLINPHIGQNIKKNEIQNNYLTESTKN